MKKFLILSLVLLASETICSMRPFGQSFLVDKRSSSCSSLALSYRLQSQDYPGGFRESSSEGFFRQEHFREYRPDMFPHCAEIANGEAAGYFSQILYFLDGDNLTPSLQQEVEDCLFDCASLVEAKLRRQEERIEEVVDHNGSLELEKEQLIRQLEISNKKIIISSLCGMSVGLGLGFVLRPLVASLNESKRASS